MKPTLLIMAAGAGSRYGKLKQLDEIGPSGEALFEYSIYDAILAGFAKVVFVINKKIEERFRIFIKNKFAEKIAVDFAFQELDSCTAGLDYSPDRIKPWGTGQAVLAAGEKINGSFLMINADDFYGRKPFQQAADSFSANQDFFVVGYPVGKTLSEYGTVNRAELRTDSEGNLIEITERMNICMEEGSVYYKEGDRKIRFQRSDLPISMNIMGFPAWIFPELQARFTEFLKKHSLDLGAEFLAPNIVNEILIEKKIKIRVLETRADWFGITFPEDKSKARQRLSELIARGEYPEKLWSEE